MHAVCSTLRALNMDHLHTAPLSAPLPPLLWNYHCPWQWITVVPSIASIARLEAAMEAEDGAGPPTLAKAPAAFKAPPLEVIRDRQMAELQERLEQMRIEKKRAAGTEAPVTAQPAAAAAAATGAATGAAAMTGAGAAIGPAQPGRPPTALAKEPPLGAYARGLVVKATGSPAPKGQGPPKKQRTEFLPNPPMPTLGNTGQGCRHWGRNLSSTRPGQLRFQSH